MALHPALRILRLASLGGDVLPAWQRAGINALLMPVPWLSVQGVPRDADHAADGALVEALGRLATASHDAGMSFYLDLALDRVTRDAVATTAEADWLLPGEELPELDPRLPAEALYARQVRGDDDAFLASWEIRLSAWLSLGVDGFLLRRPQRLPAHSWRRLLHALRGNYPNAAYIADAQGLTPDELAQRAEAGFDWLTSSLPWWDGRSDWLAAEDARLRAIAPVLAPLDSTAPESRQWAAAFTADGVLVEAAEHGFPDESLIKALQWQASAGLQGPLTVLGGHGGRRTLILRQAADGVTQGLALTPWDQTAARIDLSPLAASLPDGVVTQRSLNPACTLLSWRDSAPVGLPVLLTRASRSQSAPRLAIEAVQPAIEPDLLPVKCIAHESLGVSATLLMDGHDMLAADLCWRALDEAHWQRVPMRALGNDRWQAGFAPQRIGAHEYRIEVWQDIWAGYCRDWRSKHAAGQVLDMPLREGAIWLERALSRAADLGLRADAHKRLLRAAKTLQQALAGRVTIEHALQQLCEPSLALRLREAAERPYLLSSASYPLQVDRNRGRYANWYELFPRSQAADRHGRFDDVLARLPDIKAMGFDVLYFPPVHPIGLRNRKGRNNSLSAAPGDVGSPYAIGSADGGHDAIAPELGTLSDFDRLLQAARAQGLELALDFAIQCSPDHPWLKEHPDWFSWQADGSLRYAENPPKKYEDIVNVAFYEEPPKWRQKTPLWRALRDVVLFWAERGVRIFRVDNPHTKPLPFWRWLIQQVQARFPDTIFLAEAFTRPGMMYRLAKIGFTQSYTYFTWRNGREELSDYFAELSAEPLASFFRPHFFANTPDINPYYLQNHGRPGFLVRAALAATGSGLWGIYSGFELCEAAPVPGREEYLDSEKYELRPRDWFAPGHIRHEITQLNAIRRANPALQTHRGYEPLSATPERVMAYIKRAPGGSNVLLIVINLDPEQAAEAEVRLPAPVAQAEDLLHGGQMDWHEGVLRWHLSPDAPYGIWRLPAEPLGVCND